MTGLRKASTLRLKPLTELMICRVASALPGIVPAASGPVGGHAPGRGGLRSGQRARVGGAGIGRRESHSREEHQDRDECGTEGNAGDAAAPLLRGFIDCVHGDGREIVIQ